MADENIKQVMQDAILDADSLERFINGLEDETVLTRLSAEYPTLQKALKELFENGGIAGRFKTLADLQASPLLDGDYALVADDADDKNGIYIKESGVWIKSKYDIYGILGKSFLQRGALPSGANTLDYREQGIYTMVGGVTLQGVPSDIITSRNYMLINYHAFSGGSIIVQEIRGATNVKEGWGRIIRSNGTILSDWVSYKVNKDNLSSKYNFQRNLTTSDNLDNIVNTGLYLVVSRSQGMPTDAVANTYKFRVDAFGGFILQTLIDNDSPDKFWVRSFREGYSVPNWKNMTRAIATKSTIGEVIIGKNLNVTSSGVISTYFSGTDGLITAKDLASNFTYRKVLTSSSDDLDTIRDTGEYVVISKDVLNRPETDVTVGYLSVSLAGNFATQRWVSGDNANTTFIRVVQAVSDGEGGTNYVAKPWYCINVEHSSHVATTSKLGTIKVGANLSIAEDGTLSAASGGGNIAFEGKKMVCFGDSITEFKNYPELIKNRLGLAEAYNVGFGGCTMGAHWDADYKEMCMFRLADMVALNDYTPLINAANNLYTTKGDDNRAIAQRLASIDFNTVDFVTIFYGTNDFNNSFTIGTDDDVTADGSTFKGSINYSIKRLLEGYPHLKILLVTPIYRSRNDNGGTNGSDDSPNSDGKFLKDFVQAEIDVARLNKIPVLDMLHESGINKYSASVYLNPLPDGVHLTDAGAKHVADKIASKISCTY